MLKCGRKLGKNSKRVLEFCSDGVLIELKRFSCFSVFMNDGFLKNKRKNKNEDEVR